MQNQYKIKTGIKYCVEIEFIVNCAFLGKVHVCTNYDEKSSLQNVFLVNGIDINPDFYGKFGLPTKEQVQNAQEYLFICTDTYLKKVKVQVPKLPKDPELPALVQKYIDNRKVLNTFFKNDQDTAEIVCSSAKPFLSSDMKVLEVPVQINSFEELIATRVIFEYTGTICNVTNPHLSSVYARNRPILFVREVNTLENYIREYDHEKDGYVNELVELPDLISSFKTARALYFSI